MTSETDRSAAESEYFRTFAPGEQIFSQGDEGTLMYVIEEGAVEIVHAVGRDGGEERLAVLEPGDFFGEMALLEGEPRMATARAISTCKVLPVSAATFGNILRSNPEVSIRMMRKLCARLRSAENRLRDMQAGTGSSVAVKEPIDSSPPPAPPAPPSAPPTESWGHLVEAGGAVVELPDQDTITVGRIDRSSGTAPDVDLGEFNVDRTVSRRHARLVRKGGRRLVIEEAGTTNGTFVNGERVSPGTPAEFRVGDELRFGSVRLVLHHDQGTRE